ncbi:hypothetical protein AOXY_G2457 [Acipenser oxyrinchus oxyrinchus]|uniref:Myb/SANT-like DNA-binding domain-containing protein n=1 Tax=Acipenser oxyrinchus oxyrinchus TaxID=40147 RepID=A0AAD8GIL6_ACIOX|nr:hypothetical protein AOXY_G2457 [Acipenser oxyrinchus oxyrinchus]
MEGEPSSHYSLVILPNGISCYMTAEDKEIYNSYHAELATVMEPLQRKSLCIPSPFKDYAPAPRNTPEMKKESEHTTDVAGFSEAETGVTTWSREMVLTLINLHTRYEHKLISQKHKKKEVWAEITSELIKICKVSVTVQQTEQKWKNITKKYRDTVAHNSVFGNSLRTCSFYKELSEVYRFKPNAEMVSIATKACDVKKRKLEKSSGIPARRVVGSDTTEDSHVSNVKKLKEAHAKNSSKKEQRSAIVALVKQLQEDLKSEHQQAMDTLKKMHDEKMALMSSFLDVLKQHTE